MDLIFAGGRGQAEPTKQVMYTHLCRRGGGVPCQGEQRNVIVSYLKPLGRAPREILKLLTSLLLAALLSVTDPWGVRGTCYEGRLSTIATTSGVPRDALAVLQIPDQIQMTDDAQLLLHTQERLKKRERKQRNKQQHASTVVNLKSSQSRLHPPLSVSPQPQQDQPEFRWS